MLDAAAGPEANDNVLGSFRRRGGCGSARGPGLLARGVVLLQERQVRIVPGVQRLHRRQRGGRRAVGWW